jgi:hypothetical protein
LCAADYRGPRAGKSIGGGPEEREKSRSLLY